MKRAGAVSGNVSSSMHGGVLLASIETTLINPPWGQWRKFSKESSGIKWPHGLLIDEWHVVPRDSSSVVAFFEREAATACVPLSTGFKR